MVRTLVDKVTKDLYLLELLDDEIKYFEALWNIPEGITYNSYVLIAQDTVILFDSWKEAYADEFIEALRSVVNPEDVDYLVIHHAEPDHSGSIPKFLEVNKYRAKVMAHPIVNGILKSFYGIKPRFRSLKDKEEMVIGDKRLKFIYTPWLHWPDTIMTYVVEDKVLLSGDAFGGYSLPSAVFDDEVVISKYLPFVRKYIATVIGHYREQITRNIEKIKELGLKIKIIAPLHGLIWRKSPKTIMDYYSKLAKATPEKGKIVVIYGSMYGSMDKAASFVIEELNKRGYQPRVFKFIDVHQDPISDLVGEAMDAEAIIIGAATYEGGVLPYIAVSYTHLTLPTN